VNFEFLRMEGVISPQDTGLFHHVDSAVEAWRIIRDHYGIEEHVADLPRK
jgi:hypothetical protein